MNWMPLSIKGTPQGLLLQPKSQSWTEFLEALKQSLYDAPAFFKGGRVILDLGKRELKEDELLALRKLLNEHDIELFAVLGEDAQTQRTTRSYGIRTRLPGERHSQQRTNEPQVQGNALFLQKTLRSGQSIDFAGTIIILGDVNPGAEVKAGGNIMVWGKARGLLHAGAMGDENAVICALDMQPAQLRIAGYINRAPEGKNYQSQPEMAMVDGTMIVVQPWIARG
ncbi:MAG: septum site-determining protein MinC [Anaerolineae bacterium]|nr:septum site-determining protein MinC [Anaerolineae bacterium]